MNMVDLSVIVYCNESSHDDKPYVVANFHMRIHGQNGERLEDLPASVDRQTLTRSWVAGSRLDLGEGHPTMRLEGWQQIRSTLVGDRYVTADEVVRNQLAEGYRGRFKLRCASCGLSSSSRAENLFPVLDRLAAAGMSEISLSGLAATLRR